MDISHRGCSTLWAAALDNNSTQLKSDFALVELLLKESANAKTIFSLTSEKLLLCRVAGHGALELVTFSVNYGADVRLAAEDGPIPLYEAFRGGEEEVVRFLLKKGADVDSIGHPDSRGSVPINHDKT